LASADAAPAPSEVVVALRVPEGAAGHALLHHCYNAIVRGVDLVGGGASLAIDDAEHWCPREATDPLFSDRAAAERLINIKPLRDSGLDGENVNVVLIDRGVNKDILDGYLGGQFGTGWQVGDVQPGKIASKHGMTMACNVLKCAPKARIFDLPLLPERIGQIKTFLEVAHDAYCRMIKGIAEIKATNRFPGPWVLMNAWAVFSRATDMDPPYDYADNPDHAFNQIVARAVAEGHDVIFCAGNCGQFCPDGRCGLHDRGPGESIYGANSHPDVLTVGAVRTDTRWLGYSSQGPGQPKFTAHILVDGKPATNQKPDLCAPSQFRDIENRNAINTGTSTASAMTAGVVAALRGRWGPNRVPPAMMKDILNQTARRTDPRPWNERTGHGILDAEAAFKELVRREEAGDIPSKVS
jgi:hypothetical protein